MYESPEQIKAASAIPAPTFQTALGANITSTDNNTSLNNRLSGFDSIINNLKNYQTQISGLMNPTQQETDLSNKIGNLDTNTETALTQLDNQPIIGSIAQGQQAQVQKLASITKSGLARQLGVLQGNRQQQLDAAKFMYDSTRNNLKDTLDLYQATAPQNIGTQVNDATGDVFVLTKNPLTGEVTTQKAGNVGAKTGLTNVSIQTDPATNQLVAIGQDASGNFVSKSLGIQGQPETSLVQLADGRDVLIDKRTGNIIKTIGQNQPTYIPDPKNPGKYILNDPTTPRTASVFTKSQLNKGAAQAGVNLNDFKNFSYDAANAFINGYGADKKSPQYASTIEGKMAEIKAGLDSGANPSEIEAEISNQNMPDEVKNYLVKYLKANIPAPKAPSLWKRLTAPKK